MKKIYLLIILLFSFFALVSTQHIVSSNIETKVNYNVVIETPIISKVVKTNEIDKLKIEHNNTDIIGKIKINGTNIDEVLVQGNDNEYYLNHNIKKEKSYVGSAFIDYRNSLTDRKLLIYGHNSNVLNTATFKDLEKYLNKSFYNNNSYIDLNLNGENSKWKIFSIMIIKPHDYTHTRVSFNDLEWIDHIKWMNKNSIYNTEVEVGITDKTITIQTCYYKPKDSYLIVNAKKIEEGF